MAELSREEFNVIFYENIQKLRAKDTKLFLKILKLPIPALNNMLVMKACMSGYEVEVYKFIRELQQ